jgi:hypothetical protein
MVARRSFKSATATLRFTGVGPSEPLLHQRKVKKSHLARTAAGLADVAPFSHARPVNDLWFNGRQSIKAIEIIGVFVIVFRPAATHETILRPDETISRFGADIRKHRMVISPATKTAGSAGA